MTKEELEQQFKEQCASFRNVLKNPEGEKVLKVLEEYVRPETSSFTACDPQGRVDTHRAAFIDGRKDLYFFILSYLKETGEVSKPNNKTKRNVRKKG